MDTETQEPVDPSAAAILEALGDPGELSLDDAPPSPDATVEAQPEPSPDAVPAHASAEPPAEAQDAETPSPADPDTPESEAPTPEPFAFTADGKRVAIDGATVAGDTITLTREAWQRHVQPHLADRGQFARVKAGLEAQLQQKGVREQQSAQLVEMLQGVAGKSDEEVVEWALKLKDSLPLVLKDAEIAALKQRAPAPVEPEITDQQVEQWLDTSLQTFLDRPDYRDVKGDQRFVKRTQSRLADALPLILRQNEQGEIVADWQRFQRILDAEAADARELGQQAKRLKEIEAAAKANAQKATKPVPPTVAGTGKPTGAAKATIPATKAEYDEYIDKLAAGLI